MSSGDEKLHGDADIGDNSLDRKTLFVRSLPFDATSEDVAEFFSRFVPVKHAVVVTDANKQSRGFGFVSFSLDDDTLTALVKSRETKFKDRLLRVDIARRRDRKTNDAPSKKTAAAPIEKRRARLIVRNLPWSCKNPEELKKIFSRYGAVFDAYIPKKKGGQMCGFAFIIMKKQSAAKKAVEDPQTLKIDGREVAVDFAVEKSKWEALQEETPKKQDRKPESEIGSDNLESQKNGMNPTDDSNNEDSDNDDFVPLEGDHSDDNLNSELDEDSLESQSDSDTRSTNLLVLEEGISDEDKPLDGNSNEDNSEDHEDSEASDSEDDEAHENVTKPKSKSNRQERFSLFIRNIPYDATAEALKEHFQRYFGPVKYALPVVDKQTQISKGSAFLAFVKEDSYTKCLENAPSVESSSLLISDDVPPEYVFEGRILSVTTTVDRDSAHKLEERNKLKRKEVQGKAPEEKDKRNLFLLNEGRVTPNSKLAQYLSKTDLELREKSYKLRVEQLKKNPTLHLSLTRLAVRNIPRAMNPKALKALGRKAIVEFASEVKDEKRQPLSKEELSRSKNHKMGQDVEIKKKSAKKSGVVRQAKVINEIKGSNEVGRSRGYGFIEYRDHKSALMGLRWLNAHLVTVSEIQEGMSDEEKKLASLEGIGQRRLIVEFAVENAKVVKRRRENVLVSRMKLKEDKKRSAADDHDDDSHAKKKAKGSNVKKSKALKSTTVGNSESKNMHKKPSDNKFTDNVKQIIGKKRKKRKAAK